MCAMSDRFRSHRQMADLFACFFLGSCSPLFSSILPCDRAFERSHCQSVHHDARCEYVGHNTDYITPFRRFCVFFGSVLARAGTGCERRKKLCDAAHVSIESHSIHPQTDRQHCYRKWNEATAKQKKMTASPLEKRGHVKITIHNCRISFMLVIRLR